MDAPKYKIDQIFCRTCFQFGSHEQRHCPDVRLKGLTVYDYEWLKAMGISPR